MIRINIRAPQHVQTSPVECNEHPTQRSLTGTAQDANKRE
jgi:hypothetical protein